MDLQSKRAQKLQETFGESDLPSKQTNGAQGNGLEQTRSPMKIVKDLERMQILEIN